jgi:hypothetical protein
MDLIPYNIQDSEFINIFLNRFNDTVKIYFVHYVLSLGLVFSYIATKETKIARTLFKLFFFTLI